MVEANLDILVLDLLFKANQGLRLKEIEEALWPIARSQERFLTRERVHARIIRRLNRFVKYKWVQKRIESHKNRLYSIKDKDYVRLILAANATGWDLTQRPKPLKLPIVLSNKTYEAIVQSLSETLLAIILQQKAFTQHAHSRTRLPGVLIFGFPIPLSQEKGNVLRDKILVLAPDETSATRIRNLTEGQYEDFVKYLSNAWTLYFEERKVVHGDTVIIHFTKQQAQKLRRIVDLGKTKSVDEFVFLATLDYLDKHDSNKERFLIETDSPLIRMAIEQGKYKNKREFVETAIKEHERTLARELLQAIE